MWFYLFVINLGTFGLMWADKRSAQGGGWRVPERTLFGFVLAGGGIGGILGMRFFRHKTRKPMFYIGFPTITIIEYGLLFVLLLSRLGR